MDAPTWIGLFLTVLVALGAFVGFGLSFFVSKREVELLWAEIAQLRQRQHDLHGEILARLDRKEHGDE